MGRLPALRSSVAPLAAGAFACALSTLVGCDDHKVDPPLAPQARSQAVQATGPAPTAQLAPAAPTAEPTAEVHPVLCERQLGTSGREAPKAGISRAGDKNSLSEKLPIGGGHWTWVNLWAAWCGPCKEELPRLRSWEAKTAGERTPLKVVFVSIDDDSRQLERFLETQPPGGLHATYWLEDGPQRQGWLKEAGLEDDPSLPEQILVDPAGKVRCKQQGAVEDVDFDELLKILRGQRTAAPG